VALTNAGATCSVLYEDTSGSPHPIIASYGGDQNYAPSGSNAVSQQVVTRSTATSVSSSANPSVVGQQVTYTATVGWTQGNAPDAGGTPAGTVSFKDGGTTISGCVPQLSNGTAQCKVTYSAPSAQPHAITAKYNGTPYDAASSSSTLNQSINKAGTSISVMSSANPSDPGQQVTYTASVTVKAPGVGAPTGTVAFTDGGTTISGCGSVTLSSESAACSVTYPGAAGSPHQIVAAYSSDANFAASASTPLSQSVNKVGTSTSVMSSTNPSVSGQQVTYTATVSGGAAGTPTGTIAFTDTGATIPGCGSVRLSSRVAMCVQTDARAVDSPHQIAARYSGDGNFAASASTTLGQAVNKAATSTSLTSSANPSGTGQKVTYTATVTASSPGSGSPSGSVAFTDAGAQISGCGSMTVTGGVARCSVTYADTGGSPHPITAGYKGDGNYTASASTVLSQTIKPASSASISSSANPSVSGQQVTYTATVSSDVAGAPTGTVTFDDKGVTIKGCGAVALSGGVAHCSVTYAGPAGSAHQIVASYSGDAELATSSSAPLAQAVRRAATKLVAASAKRSSHTITFSAKLTRSFDRAPLAGETIVFSSNKHTLCRGKSNASGVAKCSTSDSAKSRPEALTAKFAGTPDYLSSTTGIQLNPVPKRLPSLAVGTFMSAVATERGPIDRASQPWNEPSAWPQATV
jgi:Bacterial Ig-like domain (group 3)